MLHLDILLYFFIELFFVGNYIVYKWPRPPSPPKFTLLNRPSVNGKNNYKMLLYYSWNPSTM